MRVLMLLLVPVVMSAAAFVNASPGDDAVTAQVVAADRAAELGRLASWPVPEEALMVLAGSILIGIAAAVRRSA